MNVVVVGGGIVGLASAYELAERGTSVTLVEKGSLGGESTQRAAGGIRTQFSTPVNVDLSLASIPTWESFEAEFGVDIGYRRNGYLFLARDDETAEGLRDGAVMQNERGGDTRILDPSEATEYCSGVRPEQFQLASYSPLDGFADPNLACQGYAQALSDVGVKVRTKTEVTDIVVSGDDGTGGDAGIGGDDGNGCDGTGRVESVELDGSEILDVDAVVNAAGPWAARLASMAGIDIPVRPKRRQVVVVDPETPIEEDAPLTIDLDTGVYFRPEREGVAIAGGHFASEDPDCDPNRYSTSYEMDWAVTCIERAADAATYFGPESRIQQGWAGLYAVTPDHHAILEETSPGFVNAVGFSGHGFQHAPATATVVADLVRGERESTVDVSALSSERFETGDFIEEQNVA